MMLFKMLQEVILQRMVFVILTLTVVNIGVYMNRMHDCILDVPGIQ